MNAAGSLHILYYKRLCFIHVPSSVTARMRYCERNRSLGRHMHEQRQVARGAHTRHDGRRTTASDERHGEEKSGVHAPRSASCTHPPLVVVMLSSSVRLSGSGPRVAPAATTAAAPIPAPLDYDDIIKLFTHRHTASLFKRQAASFRQITRERKGGLAIADLLPVCSVVALGIERIAESAHGGEDTPE